MAQTGSLAILPIGGDDQAGLSILEAEKAAGPASVGSTISRSVITQDSDNSMSAVITEPHPLAPSSMSSVIRDTESLVILWCQKYGYQ